MSTKSKSPKKTSITSSVEQKLLLVLFISAIIPMGVLVASLFTGLYPTYATIGAIVIQLVGLGIGYKITNTFSAQATSIKDTLSKIEAGDTDARATIITTDELGSAAVSLNQVFGHGPRVVPKTTAQPAPLPATQLTPKTVAPPTQQPTVSLLTQQNNPNPGIEKSIETLVSQLKRIADGDLTIRTEVKQDVTGSIAESVNHMTKQLRSIVQQVQTASEQVTNSSVQIQSASTAMSLETETHATRITDASTQLMQMNDAIHNVAQLTKDSVEVAVEARQSASKGLKAVSDTVDGMQRIRNQVQNTSRRIKSLGESSQEIGEIVQLISDITDRTSILALNASIQASMAGDAGQGFAVVAEEIERLAERSTNATKQISKLIRGIQNETSEVISDMEESTREVVAGSQLAAQAGETLFEIDSVSNQLVDLIQTSSTSALQQVENVTGIANSMTEISTSTKESAEKCREATAAVGMLANMVNELRGSVSRFKVGGNPASMATSAIPEIAPPTSQTSPLKSSPSSDKAAVNAGMQPLFEAAPASTPVTPTQRLLKPADSPRSIPKTVASSVEPTGPRTINPTTALDNDQAIPSVSQRKPTPTMAIQDPLLTSARPKTVVTDPPVSSLTRKTLPTLDEASLMKTLNEVREVFEDQNGESKPKKTSRPITLPTIQPDNES